jgi:hypothetical protein
MAKVKIQGNASGTGTVTLTAPNTNLDRTITLPDSTGTVLMTDGDGSNLTNVGVDGIVSTANATAITIDSSERVGIGTSSPDSTLHLDSTSANLPVLKLENRYESGGGTPTVTGNAPIIELYANDSGTGQPDSQELGIIEFRGSNKDSGAEELYGRIVGTNGDANTNGEFIFETQQSNVMTEALRIRGDRVVSQATAFSWLKMDGTGTISVTDSYNVSGIADNGTGTFDMNHDVNFANALYCTVCTSDLAGGSVSSNNNYVGTANLIVANTAGSNTDSGRINAVCFGDA